MDFKKFAFGTLAGGVAYFLLGFLFYGILLSGFFEANMGSATGVSKNPPDFLWLIIGSLGQGALLSYIFVRWAGISTFMTGLKAGAVIGFLVSFGTSSINYAVMNIVNVNATIVDFLVYAVLGALAGGIIGWVLGMGNK